MASSCPGLTHTLPPPQIWRAAEGSQSRLQPQLFLFPSLPPSLSGNLSCQNPTSVLVSFVLGDVAAWCGAGSQPRRRPWWWAAWRTVWEEKEPRACGGGCLHIRMIGIGEPGHLGIWLSFETNPHPIPSLGPKVPVMTSKETPLDRGPEDGGPLL